MECPRCQQAANPGALFCGNCGFQFAMTSEQAPDLAARPDTSVPTQPTEQQPDTAATQANPTLPPQPPADSVEPQQMQDHSGKAVASFVLAVVGLPAALIPILGIIFGMLAIVFGSISLHSARKVFAKIGIGVGVFVVLVSVFFWVKATQDLLTARQNGSVASNGSDNGRQQTVATPCYTTKIPADMMITKAEGSCTFLGVSPDKREQLEVKVLQIPELTIANLATAATSDAQNVVGAIPGGTIAKEAADTFAGSQAYEVELQATDGSAGTISYVYGSTAQGNLVIVLHTQAKAMGSNYDLSSIESDWAWL